jgi:hypothetical protein
MLLHRVAEDEYEDVWRIGGIGGMIVTGEYRSPRSKPTSNATLSTPNPRRTSPGINQGLRSNKPPIKDKNLSQSHFKIQFVNMPRFGHKKPTS